MKTNLLPATIALAVLLSLVAAPAAADTIHMKNGRVITSSSVRVEGDHVYIRLLGGEVRLPLSLIDRIVVDEAIEEPASVVPGREPASAPNSPAGQGAPAPGDPRDPAGQGDPAEEADPEAPGPETRQYWENLLDPLNEELAGIDSDLQRYRRRTGSDAEASILRLVAERGGVQAQINTILQDGRRLGVPSDWLR